MAEKTSTLSKFGEVVNPDVVAPRHIIGVFFVIGLFALPFGVSVVDQLTLIAALYFAIFAMSWDTVSGYTGQFSFGHSFLFAVGGYTSGLLNLGHGISPIPAIILAVIVTVVAGIVFGAPALRLSGPYFAVVTFLLPLVLLQLFVLYNNIFGGQLGLANPETLVTGSDFANMIFLNYFLALGAFLAVLGLLFVITRSNTGQIFTAIREDEVTVSASGINPTKFKLFAFVLSAAVAGFGGALFVHTPVGQPQPSQLLAIAVSINVLLASLLGGTGTITGAAAGGLLYYLLNEELRQSGFILPVLSVEVGEFSLVIFSVLVLLLVFLLPEGFLPWLTHRSRQGLARIRGEQAVTDGGTPPLKRIYQKYTDELRKLNGDDDE
jgi:branched-chain amino acid transport system permease protein